MRTARQEARHRAVIMVLVGVSVTVLVSLLSGWWRGPAMGWGAAALTYDIAVWASIARMSPSRTADHAGGEVPSPAARAFLLNSATILSLVTVALLLIDATTTHGLERALLGLLGLGTVAASWLLVHTVFTLHYAAQYYSAQPPGGVSFNQEEPPAYVDFAYLAFSLGMTYQVSDTAISSRQIRTSALIHSFYAFIFATAITATTINLVVSLF
ncbi:DUF1345 domain-containing protein [Corynebacterium nasicanis]|uniref:DUF1345 domain-containing protein n=1 Tax=Corynebacterium nasicanis TaxID=1448267 RepID=A0ABW1Q9P0_9CORY